MNAKRCPRPPEASSPPSTSSDAQARDDDRRDQARDPRASGISVSRIAAIGGTRLAFHAGMRAATSVTTTPTTRPTMIERGSIWRLVGGSDGADGVEAGAQDRGERDAEDDPDDRRDEADEERLEQHRERLTWRPEAPTARSSPTWRVRWATVILNALKMMKLPTKRAMAAKPSRKLRKMSTNDLNWSLASLAAVSPVMAS